MIVELFAAGETAVHYREPPIAADWRFFVSLHERNTRRIMNEKRRLLGMTLDELKGVAFEAGLPGYAAKQMADWLYKKK